MTDVGRTLYHNIWLYNNQNPSVGIVETYSQVVKFFYQNYAGQVLDFGDKKLDRYAKIFDKSAAVLLFRTVGHYSRSLIIIPEVAVDER